MSILSIQIRVELSNGHDEEVPCQRTMAINMSTKEGEIGHLKTAKFKRHNHLVARNLTASVAFDFVPVVAAKRSIHGLNLQTEILPGDGPMLCSYLPMRC